MADLSVLAARLTEDQRGLLAVDQAPAQLDEVLRRARVAATEANRRSLRELVLTAPGLDRLVAGVLVDPDSLSGSAPPPVLTRGRVPVGVGAWHNGATNWAAQNGASAYPGPPIGADFARRRWVSAPASTLFEREQGARQVAEWAADRQRDGVVPLVECVVRVGERDTLATASARHTEALVAVLTGLDRAGADRAATLLGVSMPLPGRRATDVATSDDTARASRAGLCAAGVNGIAGVVFTASGHPRRLAGHLAAMRWLSPDWPIGFRLGADTLVDVARSWRARPQLVVEGQRELLRQLSATSRTLCAASSS